MARARIYRNTFSVLVAELGLKHKNRQRERPSKYIGPPSRKARHTNRNRNKRSVLYAPKERELITVVGVQCVRQRSSCGCGPDHRVQLRRTSLVDGQLLRSVMYTVGAREVTSTPENGTWRGEKHDASREGAVVPRRGGWRLCAKKGCTDQGSSKRSLAAVSDTRARAQRPVA